MKIGIPKMICMLQSLMFVAALFFSSPVLAQSSFYNPTNSYSSRSVQSQTSSSSSISAASSISATSPISPTSPMASLWQKGHKSRTRIISGDTNFSSHGTSIVGVQLQIEPGWKTYWRSPGDAGVPPSFDWSGSRNLKNISISWPAPNKYKDAYSTSIGYKHEVVLPIKITAKDKTRPVDVKLRFGYGICADICVPVETKLKLTIPTRRYGYKNLLSRYQSRVPKSVTSTGKAVNGFSIHKVTVQLKGEKPHIVVDARVPVDTKKAELFAEASNGFYLPLPVGERPSAGNRRRFHIDLTKSDPAKELQGKTLALTLVGNKTGIEYKLKIN